MRGEKISPKAAARFVFRTLSFTLISIVSFVLAFLIRFEFNVNTPVFDAWFSAYANNVVQLALIAMFCFVGFDILFSLKRKQFWSDFIKIILLVGTIELLTYFYMFGKPQSLVRSVYIISFLLMFFFLFQARFVANFFSWKRWQIRKQKAKDDSELEKRESRENNYIENLDKLAFATINSKLEGRNVLVSGAGEDFGRALCELLSNFKTRRLILLDNKDKDLLDTFEKVSGKVTNTIVEAYLVDGREKEKIERIFEKYRPHVVFHLGGYKHYIDNDENRKELISANLSGTRHMLENSIKNLAESFVFLSQKYSGAKEDLPGRIKKKEERLLKELSEKENTNFYVYRLSAMEKSKEEMERLAGVMLEMFTVKGESSLVETEE